MSSPQIKVSQVQQVLDALPSRVDWPRFDLRSVPVAIYDGEATWLIHHPRPPSPFELVAGHKGLYVMRGQHPAVRANSSADMGGIDVATLLLEKGGPPRDLAALTGLLAHESFHVYQTRHHHTWRGNEADLFLYPVEDSVLLAWRRLETEALRRALETSAPEEAACWAHAALAIRQNRYAQLPATAVSYERGSELNEGLAQYIEFSSQGLSEGPALPIDEYSAEQVRQRSYDTGHALATLLDRFDSTRERWKEIMEGEQVGSLDELLAAMLPPSPRECRFTPVEQADSRARAERDVASLKIRRAAEAQRIRREPGWQLVINVAAGCEPLWPQGFDPLNSERLNAALVLHRRWLKLGNSFGSVEVLGREALTEAASDHPIMKGVRALTIPGFIQRPQVQQIHGRLLMVTPSVRAEFDHSMLEEHDKVIFIQVRCEEGMTPSQ